jgi:hypothetical protein
MAPELGGAVIVLDNGGVLGVLTRDRRGRRDVRLALGPALGLDDWPDPAGTHAHQTGGRG